MLSSDTKMEKSFILGNKDGKTLLSSDTKIENTFILECKSGKTLLFQFKGGKTMSSEVQRWKFLVGYKDEKSPLFSGMQRLRNFFIQGYSVLK